MSKYVNRMKDVLVSFNAAALEIQKKLGYSKQHFSGEDLAGEQNKLQIQLNQAAENARAQIDAIREEASEAARKWAVPNGDNIDAADYELLKGGFDLSAEDLHQLLVKHQGNSVMVNAIAKYAGNHGIVLDYVPNLADKLMAYTSFSRSAHRVISNIAGNIGLHHDDFTIVKWAEPGNISQRMETVLYGIRAHGSASEDTPQGTFDFDFKHLNGR